MDSLFVSIVIPCLNEEKYIESCIDSIKKQLYGGKYEIIAVDNGSVDNTVKIIREKGVILELAQKRGPAAAKNAGLEKARGDVIVFIDADCVADPEWLGELLGPLQSGDTGCVAGEIIPQEPKTDIELFLTKKNHLSQFVNVGHSFLPFAATANAAYRKEVFQKVGLFDETLLTGEDADMTWRMQLATGYKLRYAPKAIAFHPQETTLKGLFKQKERHACGAVALYKKYKNHWRMSPKSPKILYWEYYSLIRRLLKYFKEYLTGCTRQPDESLVQTILEAGWKLGLIRGSLKYRVWYI